MRLLALALVAGGVMSAQTATFHKNVAPILQMHCQECHRQGQVAPFQLETYKQARGWSATSTCNCVLR